MERERLTLGLLSDPDNFFEWDMVTKEKFRNLREKVDVWILASKITPHGYVPEFVKFFRWFETLPSDYKIVVPGSTDSELFKNNPLALKTIENFRSGKNNYYLEDTGVLIKDRSFYGMPYFECPDQIWLTAKAFAVKNKAEYLNHLEQIPDDTDVLITGTPPYGILDTRRLPLEKPFHVGSEDLFYKVMDLQPMLHCFTCIGNHGIVEHGGTFFVNSTMRAHDETVKYDYITIKLP